MRAMIAIALVTLTACSAVQDTINKPSTPEESRDRATLRMEREKQRQFERCMKLILGDFSNFKTTEAKMKAAEVCKKENPTP